MHTQASLQSTQKWEEWWVQQTVVQPFRGPWQDLCRTDQGGMLWSSAMATAQSCIWRGASLCTGTHWGLHSLQAALLRSSLGSCQTTSWAWASSDGSLQRWPTVSWAIFKRILPAGWRTLSFLSPQHWWSIMQKSAESSSGLSTTSKLWMDRSDQSKGSEVVLGTGAVAWPKGNSWCWGFAPEPPCSL